MRRTLLHTPLPWPLRITSMRDAVVESDGECEIIVGLTRPIKAMLMSTCILPRYFIDVYLLWLGCRWLAATPSFGDLLLNAAARWNDGWNVNGRALCHHVKPALQPSLFGTFQYFPSLFEVDPSCSFCIILFYLFFSLSIQFWALLRSLWSSSSCWKIPCMRAWCLTETREQRKTHWFNPGRRTSAALSSSQRLQFVECWGPAPTAEDRTCKLSRVPLAPWSCKEGFLTSQAT